MFHSYVSLPEGIFSTTASLSAGNGMYLTSSGAGHITRTKSQLLHLYTQNMYTRTTA
jgi:hypothetical protein